MDEILVRRTRLAVSSSGNWSRVSQTLSPSDMLHLRFRQSLAATISAQANALSIPHTFNPLSVLRDRGEGKTQSWTHCTPYCRSDWQSFDKQKARLAPGLMLTLQRDRAAYAARHASLKQIAQPYLAATCALAMMPSTGLKASLATEVYSSVILVSCATKPS